MHVVQNRKLEILLPTLSFFIQQKHNTVRTASGCPFQWLHRRFSSKSAFQKDKMVLPPTKKYTLTGS